MPARVRGYLSVTTRCDCPIHHGGHQGFEPVNEIVPVELDGTPAARQEALTLAAHQQVYSPRRGGLPVDEWSWEDGVEVTPAGEDQLLRRIGAPSLFGNEAI